MGLLLDTTKCRVSLSPERCEKMWQLLETLLATQQQDVLMLARLLGMMVSCQDVMPCLARFHARALQRFLLRFQQEIENNVHYKTSIPPKVKKELAWWRSRSKMAEGSPLCIPEWTVITTDASLLG